MRKSSILFIFIIVFINSAFSQHENDEYFDDGGISSSRSSININLASLIVGDFSFGYERTIGNVFKIEAGVGLLLSYYNTEMIPYFYGRRRKFSNTSP